MMNHVLGAKCIRCGKEREAKPDITTCPACGGMLDIQYDYAAIAREVSHEVMANRTEQSMWRYMEYLPVLGKGKRPKLRVGWSPFYKADRLAKVLGLKTLYVKDDGVNPTASLKDRARRSSPAPPPATPPPLWRETPPPPDSPPTSLSPPGPPRGRSPS